MKGFHKAKEKKRTNPLLCQTYRWKIYDLFGKYYVFVEEIE